MQTDLPRAERAAEAAELRAQGLTYRAIADRMGISRSYANDLLLDPDGLKAQLRKAGYGRPCKGCGKLTSGSYGRAKAPEFCVACTRERSASRHGTLNRYRRYGCRCGECKAAASEYGRAMRERCDPPRHGTVSGYTNHGCRCDACSAAHRRSEWLLYDYKRLWVASKRGTEPPTHGTWNAYSVYACRCDVCRAFAAEKRRA